jgi:hypothetical protein
MTIGGRSAEWTQLDAIPPYTNLIFFRLCPAHYTRFIGLHAMTPERRTHGQQHNTLQLILRNQQYGPLLKQQDFYLMLTDFN